MSNLRFRQQLLAKQTLIGTLVSIPSAEIVELLSFTGFDWIFLDAEHGAFGPTEIVALLQAAHDCPCLVRIPGPDEAWIKKILDAGAAGIIVPQISTEQQARDVIQFAKYPPQGKRGVGLGRAHKYGRDFAAYLQNANQETVIVLQAENQQALDNIDAIAAVDGVDAILIGPYDLSASLGHTGEVAHATVQAAIQKISQVCQSHDTRLGIFGVCAADVAPYKQLGFTLLTVGVDSLFIEASASSALSDLRAG